MNEYVVGTYNMSFASDGIFKVDDEEENNRNLELKFQDFPSETSFLKRNKNHERDLIKVNENEKIENLNLNRAMWNNAKETVTRFLTEKNPIAVGLQEMNYTDKPGLKYNVPIDINNFGTAAIKKALNNEILNKYDIFSGEINTGFSLPALSIIYDKSRVGEIKHSLVIDNDNQKGRPLMLIYTAEDFLFINAHGAQDAKLREDKKGFNNYMIDNNQTFIENKTSEFINKHNIRGTIKHIFVMGDFNDRYDAIKSFNINSTVIHHTGASPKSCCHNWDSSASENGKRKVELKDELKGFPYYTATPPVDKKILNGVIPDEEVKVTNYLYKGDKVFSDLGGMLEIFKSEYDDKGVSIASDHEFVYITSILNETPASKTGGKRKTRRTRKSRKSKRAKKARKTNTRRKRRTRR